jgi:hypothetical protein
MVLYSRVSWIQSVYCGIDSFEGNTYPFVRCSTGHRELRPKAGYLGERLRVDNGGQRDGVFKNRLQIDGGRCAELL